MDVHRNGELLVTDGEVCKFISVKYAVTCEIKKKSSDL